MAAKGNGIKKYYKSPTDYIPGNPKAAERFARDGSTVFANGAYPTPAKPKVTTTELPKVSASAAKKAARYAAARKRKSASGYTKGSGRPD